MVASLVADQSISFDLMSEKLQADDGDRPERPGGRERRRLHRIGRRRRLVANQHRNGLRVAEAAERARRRRGGDGAAAAQAGQLPGGRLYLNPVQDIRIGGRSGNAEYQYTILGDNTAEVYEWGPKLLAAVQNDPALTDVSSDQQQKGLETNVSIDRDTASRLGLTMYQIDNTLYDAFGQRSVSTIYNALNQYHVVMEVAPRYLQRPAIFRQFWVSTSGGRRAGLQTSQLSGGSVTGGSVLAVATPSVASTPVVRRRSRARRLRRRTRHSPSPATRSRSPAMWFR